uniref:Coiled-coil domain-containing protein 86 n=1 Tax=Eucampia antarctica TaxID=49252 RepID=A0A7S2RP40_9STRA|mmetsp:Transcript_24913/g.23917  ORF Transcript_24913/g.23917 Transcript_24913/m.23917 type:complete len:171 (+) Transcript_24913:40-552(+)|eukprot:CAMPEP_0197835346 /NCGR_PEP_ID=MMETSP1437-20131217/25445_1 /TAXON_ID=49252 ORGANISM="Eucampia antarctica, Strain CCMP1452" /NCGR_SAMPLE_ID=MMETSP1437 /ASSEMBLY_ACC=CAM_ASM_001096 /LENGTH=170 /DNA_ID=CAMNT_0043440695 /DNA_START=34 /DNA_END=546 /DNA_ORIENTATION=-
MTRKENPITTVNQYIHGDITKLVETGFGVTTNKKSNTEVPNGRNASGRNWKVRAQKRASSLVTSNPQNAKSKTWERKANEKKLRLAIKEKTDEMKEERRQAAIAKKERRLENQKRRMENEFKVASRSAQVLGKNVDMKLKAMSKKQLRQIKKTRINTKTGTVEYVGAYTK